MAASRWATALRATIAAVIVAATEVEIVAATAAPVAAAVAEAALAAAAAAAVTATEMKRTREAKASRVFLPEGVILERQTT